MTGSAGIDRPPVQKAAAAHGAADHSWHSEEK